MYLYQRQTTEETFVTSGFHKTASVGLYDNFTSFTPFCIGLDFLIKSMYPSQSIDPEIVTFLRCSFADKEVIVNICFISINYHILVLIRTVILKTFTNYAKDFVKVPTLKKVSRHLKINDLFSTKDALPTSLKSFVLYKFFCADCQYCYAGGTTHHLPTRI